MPNPPKFDFSTLPDNVLAVLEQLDRKKINYWLVGGFVRDWIAGGRSADIDLVAAANPWKIAHAIKGTLISCRHPIVIKGNLQISPAKGLDLSERDFNANAIAIDKNGTVIDPWGGIRDIQKKELNLLANLASDPIRILRGCRLSARLGWHFGKRTEESICNFAPRFAPRKETMMRIGLELRKSFDDIQPSVFLRTLRNYGILGKVCQPLNHSWNIGSADAILAECDSASPGLWDERMTAILSDPSADPGKTAQRAYNYLLSIKWDLLASDFGRIDSYPHHASDIASTLLLKDGLPGPEKIVAFARSAQTLGHLSISKISEISHRMKSLNISENDLERLTKNLKKRIAAGLPDAASLRACLYLSGLNKRSVKRHMEKVLQ